MVAKRWLAVVTATCALCLAVAHLVYGPLQIIRAWCYSLLSFVTNRTIARRSSIGGLYVCEGGLAF